MNRFNQLSMAHTAERVSLGLQCPECFGVRIETRRTYASDHVQGFTCTECGCQFGSCPRHDR
jgi:Zn ribbon nucleic-acid-binding protein